MLSGSKECFEGSEENGTNRCNMTLHNTEAGRTGNAVFENGEAIFAYFIERDGSLVSVPSSDSAGLSNSDLISGLGVAIQGYCAVFGCN